MLGILLIYFIGKYYYDLAGKYEKHQWGFAILGVLTYYVGTFLAGIIMAISYELFSLGDIESVNDLLLGFMALPFGVLLTYGIYQLLRKRWSENVITVDDEIDHFGVN